MRHPSRVPTWDAIVLTAASPEQAALYEWQLKRAKRMGRIAASTVTIAVPDPLGQRIGSGAATLNAVNALARHYQNLGLGQVTASISYFTLILPEFLLSNYAYVFSEVKKVTFKVILC